MAVVELSTLGYVRTIILCILLQPRRGQASPIPSLQESSSFSRAVGAMDLSTLKQEDHRDVQALLGHFLYMLNLTDQGLQTRPRTHAEPPEYMLELYNQYGNQYANDRTNMPAANIARSFKNEDSSPPSVTSRGVRTHPLMFNVSVPDREHIVAAEIRLYLLVHRDPHHHNGVDWKMTIFEILGEDGSPPWQRSEGVEGESGENNLVGMQELVGRHGHSRESRWEVFDVTDVVRRWRKSKTTSHWLQLHVENVNSAATESQLPDEEEQSGLILTSLDIDRNPKGKHEPVLIVFSDKESDNRRENHKDMPGRVIAGGNIGLQNINGLEEVESEDGEKQQNEHLLMQTRSNILYDNAPRTRRNAKEDHCKRTSLYVDFKDIGWDSWILAPAGFEAYMCHGSCSYPLTSQHKPTQHAIIQTLVNLKSPKKVSQACCVPTKLDPISLLYENENGHVIFQQRYEGMVVAECGCT
ncbi:bone morphogenetic protein 10 [Brachyhypopomus gauderio]|uniref:bone morphogenetic protein 10 n=1 Tax=Brachyhypopomus gauderio TaxID=698409 RepID=UPI004041D297